MLPHKNIHSSRGSTVFDPFKSLAIVFLIYIFLYPKDYLTVAFFRFDHGLKTFFPSSDVLLNACIPTVHVPFGTFLNVAVTVPSLRFSFL